MNIALRAELCLTVLGEKKIKGWHRTEPLHCRISGEELWVLQELVSVHGSHTFLPSHLLHSLLAPLQLKPVDVFVGIIPHPLILGCA